MDEHLENYLDSKAPPSDPQLATRERRVENVMLVLFSIPSLLVLLVGAVVYFTSAVKREAEYSVVVGLFFLLPSAVIFGTLSFGIGIFVGSKAFRSFAIIVNGLSVPIALIWLLRFLRSLL